MGDYGHQMMGFGYGGILMWILWIVIITVIVYALTRIFKSGNLWKGSSEKPLDILKKRYARGEISKEEYEYMKKELQ